MFKIQSSRYYSKTVVVPECYKGQAPLQTQIALNAIQNWETSILANGSIRQESSPQLPQAPFEGFNTFQTLNMVTAIAKIGVSDLKINERTWKNGLL